MAASVQPSAQEASTSGARRRVAGALRLRALRHGLPTKDIVRAYGTAMCEPSRAGRIATGRLSTCCRPYARQPWPPIAAPGAGATSYRAYTLERTQRLLIWSAFWSEVVEPVFAQDSWGKSRLFPHSQSGIERGQEDMTGLPARWNSPKSLNRDKFHQSGFIKRLVIFFRLWS
jgi:hypothetical protein